MSNSVKTSVPVRKVKLIAKPKEFIPLFKETLENDRKQAEIKKFKDEVSKEVQRVVGIAVEKEREKINKEYEIKLQEKFEEGKTEGIGICGEENRERVESALDTLKEIIKDINDKRMKVIENAEKDVLEIASFLAERVIFEKVNLEKEIVIDLVRDTLKYVAGESKLKLKLNPQDIETIQNVKEDLLSEFEEISEIDLVEEKSMIKGGCVIETASGIIDSDIRTRFDSIKKELLKDI